MAMKRKDPTPETAYDVGRESSSTSNTLNSSPEREYDVFLSFAGKDTRLNFTGHLYEALKRSGIKTFRDDVDLEKGKDINNLFQAIEDSLCAVVVISKTYAKSKWCLDELQKILESQNTSGRRVFPVFYDVNPADVTKQRGSFGEVLAELEQELEEDTTSKAHNWTSAELEKKLKENTTKVENWRTALSTIGNLSGWPTKEKHEADLIKNIVGDVWSFLSTKLPSFDDNLVGIDSKVADVIPFLEIGLEDDKCFIGIWGMGGVGKTTLARVVSEKLSDKFEICCFLEKVKDVISKGHEGLVSLQNRLLSHLQIKGLNIIDSYKGMLMIRRHFCNKKVLLVLDDIDDRSQLNYLAESPYWFGKGSRIIITTRNRHVFALIGVERIYKMKTMKDDESLQIFSKKAFNKNHPEEKYLEYSKSMVKYVGGLPLALQALGSQLCGRREHDVWKEVLDKLKQINPHKNILQELEILQVLQISYDGLNEKEQTIFLDIVSLFKGWKKEKVTQMLKACDLDPILGIIVLIEKTLLVETEDGILDAHDLYVELGWHIIQQKFHRSRLRKFEEIKEVLENDKGFGEIEAIVMTHEHFGGDQIKIHPETFLKMSRLRLLILDGPTYTPRGLKELSGALRFVQWPNFPLETLPLPLENLVHIKMPHSNIMQLWNGKRFMMKHLKFIDLFGSRKLTETPDFSNVQSLEHLCLSFCKSLVKVHESLGVLKELVMVDLRFCEKLNSLPSKLETNSLRELNLGGCKNIKKLPEFGESMKQLSYLDAHDTAITTLPETFESLTGLRFLNLSATGVVDLPIDCLSGLCELVFLSLRDCKRLVSLPRLPPRLIRLEADGCNSMKSSLDEQLLTLVTSLDHECRGKTKCAISDKEENMPFAYAKHYHSLFKLRDFEPENLSLRHFFAIMPSGGKIPSWFHPKIKYYDEERYECEIEVDVPSNVRASEWSGIVVCLHIKGRDGLFSWSSKAPEDDEYNTWEKRPHGIFDLHGDDGLCVMVLEFNQKTCWQHLRGDNNSLHIQLSSDYSCSLRILGCGWKVIRKEDIQNWRLLNQFIQPQHAHAPPLELKLPVGLVDRVLGS